MLSPTSSRGGQAPGPSALKYVWIGLGLIVLVNIAWLFRSGDQAPRGLRVSEAAPAFSLPIVFPEESLAATRTDGVAGPGSDPRRVTLLLFFATWSPASVDELDGLLRVSRNYDHRGLKVVAVSAEPAAQGRVQAWVKRARPPFNVVLDEGGTVSSRYGVTVLPERVLVDKDGVVRRLERGAQLESEAALAKELDKLLP
jgi:peroxiredoxin